jgi:hypothetical protein
MKKLFFYTLFIFLNINTFANIQEVSNLLRVQFIGGNGADEFVVYFDTLAENGYNPEFDSEKYMSDAAGVPNIYTYADSVKVSINVLNSIGQGLTVPIGLRTKISGNYLINIIDLSSFNPTVGIFLEDMTTGIISNLRTTTQYSVYLTVGEFNQRFKLHFYPGLIVTILNESCLQSDGQITINNPSSLEWNYYLLKVNGDTIGSSSLTNYIFSNLDEGSYSLLMNNFNYSVEDIIYIESTDEISGNILPMNTIYYINDTIESFVENPNSNFEYYWYLNEILLDSGPNISFNITNAGLYNLKLKIYFENCEFETSNSFSVIQNITDIKIINSPKFIIYPNPSKDILNIKIIDKNFNKISIFNEFGTLVFNSDIKNEIIINELSIGIYQIILEGIKIKSSSRFIKYN